MFGPKKKRNLRKTNVSDPPPKKKPEEKQLIGQTKTTKPEENQHVGPKKQRNLRNRSRKGTGAGGPKHTNTDARTPAQCPTPLHNACRKK